MAIFEVFAKLAKEIHQEELGQLDWASLLGGVGTTVLGAVSNVLGGTSKGSLVGGTVQSSGGGRITIKTTSGKLVTIKRAKHRRRGYSRGGGMNSMLKQAMQYKMLSQAMK